jgi:hypothetical protein
VQIFVNAKVAGIKAVDSQSPSSVAALYLSDQTRIRLSSSRLFSAGNASEPGVPIQGQVPEDVIDDAARSIPKESPLPVHTAVFGCIILSVGGWIFMSAVLHSLGL